MNYFIGTRTDQHSRNHCSPVPSVAKPSKTVDPCPNIKLSTRDVLHAPSAKNYSQDYLTWNSMHRGLIIYVFNNVCYNHPVPLILKKLIKAKCKEQHHLLTCKHFPGHSGMAMPDRFWVKLKNQKNFELLSTGKNLLAKIFQIFDL